MIIPLKSPTQDSSANGEEGDPEDAKFWEALGGGKRTGAEDITHKTMSEDCLYLNVWAPLDSDGNVFQEGNLRPVMVFIHGGFFVIGSAFSNLYEGSLLSIRTGTVVVTLNYRLGVFGFLYNQGQGESFGNAGLQDQSMALKWVQRNIKSFGGEP